MSGARVMVDRINHSMRTTVSGEYWRLLSPGQYTLMAVARDGTRSRQVPVTVTDEGRPQIVNLVLDTSY